MLALPVGAAAAAAYFLLALSDDRGNNTTTVVVTTTPVVTADKPAGTVVDQAPKPGEQVQPGAQITLSVAKARKREADHDRSDAATAERERPGRDRPAGVLCGERARAGRHPPEPRVRHERRAARDRDRTGEARRRDRAVPLAPADQRLERPRPGPENARALVLP